MFKKENHEAMERLREVDPVHLADENPHCCGISVCCKSLPVLLPLGQVALFLELCLRE